MAAGSARAWGWLPGAGAWLTVLLAVGRAGLGFLMLTTAAFWKVGGCLGGRSRPGVTGRLSGIRVFGLTCGRGTDGQVDDGTFNHGPRLLENPPPCKARSKNESFQKQCCGRLF